MMQLELHSVECAYTSDNGLSTPQNHVLLLRQDPNTSTCMGCFDSSKPCVAASMGPQCQYMHGVFRLFKTMRCCFDGPPIPVHAWDFPDVIKFYIAALQWEKEIRFRHPAQKLISSSISRHLSTVHPNPCMRFWVILHTDKQTRACGQKHRPPPLSEVKNYDISAQKLCHDDITILLT